MPSTKWNYCKCLFRRFYFLSIIQFTLIKHIHFVVLYIYRNIWLIEAISFSCKWHCNLFSNCDFCAFKCKVESLMIQWKMDGHNSILYFFIYLFIAYLYGYFIEYLYGISNQTAENHNFLFQVIIVIFGMHHLSAFSGFL